MSNKSFNIRVADSSFLKIKRHSNGEPIIKTYIFYGRSVKIEFYDGFGKSGFPCITNYWKVKIRDIDPILIRSFSLPEFSQDTCKTVRVEVDMFLPENWDETKYYDIILEPTKEELLRIRKKKLERLLEK